jgi:hypothetical protein
MALSSLIALEEACGVRLRRPVDRLHQLAEGRLNQFCFHNISTYPFS